jgi:hypothetical protein
MKRLLVVSLPVAAALAALFVAVPASAHENPCHSSHTCPSDHETYLWHGLYCTSYAAVRLATDRRTVVYDNRMYWCQPEPPRPAPIGRTITVATSSALTPSSQIKLHDLVSAGAMTLRAAQRQIAANWKALYKRVFGIAA